MYSRSPGPTFSHGPSLVSKARHTSPSRPARGPAPFTSRGGKHRHRPACFSLRASFLGVTKLPCFAVASASAAPLRRRAGHTPARPAPLAALPGNPAPPPPNPGQHRAGLGGFMGGCLAGGPPHPPENTTKTPRPQPRSGLSLRSQTPLPSFPTPIPAAASTSPSRRRKAPPKTKRAGIKFLPNPPQTPKLYSNKPS